jgi:uncharacterized RDD family membrane protein YckC
MTVLRFLMFNKFVVSYLNNDSWFLRLNKRLKTFALEMWYMLSMFFPILATFLFLKMRLEDSTSKDFQLTDLLGVIPMPLVMTIILNKDFFNGQSVVHRKLGYKVLDSGTNETASKVQCFVRNLTAVIWPVEVVFVLISPKRRLGDILAQTMLVDVPISQPDLILAEIKEFELDQDAKLTFVVSVLFLVAYSALLFFPRLWWYGQGGV